ncbi:MAG: hypothetical protein ACXQTZ_00380, partial [Candidatus Alkanophagales archaeon]
MRAVFFDLEGPLSPQDNAYEVMSSIENGDKIFEVLSRYDDIVSLEGREGYEAGDTLALIVPFLVAHGISEADIRRVSGRAPLTNGARELVSWLRSEGWRVFVISTSYEQHALSVGARLGIEPENVFCTRLDLSELRRRLPAEALTLVRRVEKEILEFYEAAGDERRIVERLDEFFFEELPRHGYDVLGLRVVGGRRKVEAMLAAAEKSGVRLEDCIAVGDSITDQKMLEEARKRAISVVFNGNEYAVPFASVGLASTDLRFLHVICEAFVRGGKEEVRSIAEEWERRVSAPQERGFPEGFAD